MQWNHYVPSRKGLSKIALVMKLTFLLIAVATLRVSAETYAQNISFSGRNVPMEKVFTAIKEQTGYVIFCDYTVLQSSLPVTLDTKDMPLEDFLALLLKDR